MKTFIISIICLLFFGCTISEKTTVHIFPPPTEDILVQPFVETLGETSAIIVWQINNTSNSYLDLKTKDSDAEIIVASVTNEIFRAVLTNLNPNTKYFYRLAGTSDVFSKFRTLSPERKNYSFGVLGDNRTNPDKFKKTADAISKHDVDFFVHTGDLLSKGTNIDEWYSQWFTPGRRMLEKAPVFVAWGNHEYPWDEKSGINIFYPDRSQFNNKGYYSYRNGNVLFIHINTYEPFKPGSKQYIWLEEKLKTCKLPFIVAALHVSAFTGAGHADGNDVKEVRQFVVPILAKYNVNLVVSGHDHVYDRSEYAETTYVISGGAGAPLYDPGTYLNPFSVKAKKSLHFVIFSPSVSNITANTYDIDGNIIDSFSISPRKIPEIIPKAFTTFRPPWHGKIESTDFDVFIRPFLSNEISGVVTTEISKDFEVLPSNNFKFKIGAEQQIKTLNFKLKLKDKTKKEYPVKVTVAVAGVTNIMEFTLNR